MNIDYYFNLNHRLKNKDKSMNTIEGNNQYSIENIQSS